MWIERLIKKIFKNNQKEFRVTSSELRVNNSKLETGNSKLNQEVKERTDLEIINQRLTKLEADLDKAIGGYRLSLIGQNPEILPELISGGSIEELDKSLESARDLTKRIREKLNSQTAAERIPSGSPARMPLDTSSLSSYEKIVYGLEQK